VEIVIPGAVAGGTYDLTAQGGVNAWAVYGPDQIVAHGFWSYSPPSGTITVSILSATRCAGAFSFKGKNPSSGNTVDLINGTFNVPHGGPP
jgi:hypothetical protein